MAGKKGSGKHSESKGERVCVAKWILKANRRAYLTDGLTRVNNQLAAWKRNKPVYLTIANTDKEQKNKKFIRVPAKQVWGVYNPKHSVGNAALKEEIAND